VVLITLILIFSMVDFNKLFNSFEQNSTLLNNSLVKNDTFFNQSGNINIFENNDDLIMVKNKTYLEDLGKDEMYYCFKKNFEGKIIFKSYLSRNNFYEVNYFNDVKNYDLVFYGGKLYQRAYENGCDWIINDYEDIFENFRLTYQEYLNNDKYNCSKIKFDKKIFNFKAKNLSICDDEILDYYNQEDLGIEN